MQANLSRNAPQRIVGKAVVYTFLAALVILMNYPFIWMLTTSVKSVKEVYRFPPPLLPEKFLWYNYVEAWKVARWGRYFINSIIASSVPAIGAFR